jgi:hypothetical protein
MDLNYAIGTFKHALNLFKGAVLCLYETVMGKELSCPPCIFCATLRLVLAVIIIAAFVMMLGLGVTLVLALAVSVILFFVGEGFWVQVRAYVRSKLAK